MEITDVTKIECFIIETTEDYQSKQYTRYDADCWTERIGESDEPLYNCEEIENLYQDWLSKNAK